MQALVMRQVITAAVLITTALLTESADGQLKDRLGPLRHQRPFTTFMTEMWNSEGVPTQASEYRLLLFRLSTQQRAGFANRSYELPLEALEDLVGYFIDREEPFLNGGYQVVLEDTGTGDRRVVREFLIRDGRVVSEEAEADSDRQDDTDTEALELEEAFRCTRARQEHGQSGVQFTQPSTDRFAELRQIPPEQLDEWRETAQQFLLSIETRFEAADLRDRLHPAIVWRHAATRTLMAIARLQEQPEAETAALRELIEFHERFQKFIAALNKDGRRGGEPEALAKATYYAHWLQAELAGLEDRDADRRARRREAADSALQELAILKGAMDALDIYEQAAFATVTYAQAASRLVDAQDLQDNEGLAASLATRVEALRSRRELLGTLWENRQYGADIEADVRRAFLVAEAELAEVTGERDKQTTFLKQAIQAGLQHRQSIEVLIEEADLYERVRSGGQHSINATAALIQPVTVLRTLEGPAPIDVETGTFITSRLDVLAECADVVGTQYQLATALAQNGQEGGEVAPLYECLQALLHIEIHYELQQNQ